METRQHYNKNWQEYIKCNKCWQFKPATLEFRGKNSSCFMGLRSICKECDKKSRETDSYKTYYKNYRQREEKKIKDKEYKRRTADTDIWERRRAYTREYNKIYRQTHKEEIKEYNESRKQKMQIEKRTRLWANRLNIIPSCCPICGKEAKIILHHPDYSKRYEVVMCCSPCHRRIHAWRDIPQNIINIKDIIKEKNYFDWTNNHAKKVFDKAEEWILFYNRKK